jgi:hypothetical protein
MHVMCDVLVLPLVLKRDLLFVVWWTECLCVRYAVSECIENTELLNDEFSVPPTQHLDIASRVASHCSVDVLTPYTDCVKIEISSCIYTP